MSAKVFVWAVLALLILGIVFFRYRTGPSTLHIDPHAAAEIQKAKQR